MRNFLAIFGLLLFASIATPAVAQSGSIFQKNATTPDTLVNRDTLIYYIGGDFSQGVWDVSAIVRADSISGATAATILLQVANTNQASALNANLNWVTADTETIDGAGTTLYRLTHTLVERRARLFILTPNTTARRIVIRYDVATKRRE